MSLPLRNATTEILISGLRYKRGLLKNPQYLQDRATLLSLSRRWANQNTDELQSAGVACLLKLSEERTPQTRICLALDKENWFSTVRTQLPGVPYRRHPLKAHNQVWYFLENLDGLRKLLGVVPSEALRLNSSGDGGADLWRQRVRVPFSEENYHTHLRYYLQERRIRFVRIASNAEGVSWYFMNTAEDVQGLLAGLDSFQDVLVTS